MQTNPVSHPNQNVDHDVDTDSLFGSPPSPPRGRGRSPSPLALPGAAGSAQNVGTLALPGSHLVAEVSVHPSASSPLSVNDRATNVALPSRIQIAEVARAQLVRNRSAAGHVAHGGSAVASGSHASSVQRKSRKGKEKARGGSTSRSSTPRPAAPQIPIPSPDQPLPPNFLRNQQALLGVAGLVGGVNPSQLAPQPGTTAHNPIVLDEVEDDDQPRSIGRRPLTDSTAPYLPAPRGSEVLQTLAKQGSVLPLVESLVRLLAGTATATTLPPKSRDRTGWERLKPSEPPPLKRRKLNSVPAGANDWDVPYPFQEGQGPAGYRSTWAKERARRLVRELVSLVRDAAKKAAVKGYLQEQERARKRKWMDERGWQGRVGGHYKERTAFFGLEDGLLQARARSMAPCAGVVSATTPSPQTELNTTGPRQTMSEPPPPPPFSSSPTQSASATSINQWLASMLAGTPPTVQEEGQVERELPQATQDPAPSSSATDPAEGMSGNQYFDDWLALLESIPPGDPNDPAALPDLRNVLDDFTTGATAEGFASTSSNVFDIQGQGPEAFPDFSLDPSLFDVPVSPDPPSTQVDASVSTPISTLSSSTSHISSTPHPDGPARPGLLTQDLTTHGTSYLSPIVPGASASTTPSLTGSPLASTASLADAEHSPATPEWTWVFNELGVVGGGGPVIRGSSEHRSLDGGAGLGTPDASGEVNGFWSEELSAFQKALEEASGPTGAHPTSELGHEDDCGVDMMDVDSVGLGGGLSMDTETRMASTIPALPSLTTPSSTVQDGVQAHGVSAVESAKHVTTLHSGGHALPSAQLPFTNHDLNPSARWFPTSGSASAGLHGSDATSYNVPTAFPPAPSTQAVAGPSAPTAPALLAAPGPSNLRPPSHTSASPLAHSGAGGPSAPSPLNALNSLLAMTNASKPASTSRLTRAEVLQRARAMRRDLERARERARVELWETTVEGACLVGLGREVTKSMGDGAASGR